MSGQRAALHGGDGGSRPQPTTQRAATLPLVGLAVGVWAVLPPYLGPGLLVDPLVEVVDHVVPGIIVLVVSAAALAARARAGDLALFAGGLLIALAGFWMVATHVPLLAQAAQGVVPWGTATWHTAPGIAVGALGAAGAVHYGRAPASEAGVHR